MGAKMQILVIDRCKRLMYQLIPPWSTVSYPYVKAAILSTFIDDTCGDCIETSTETPTESSSNNDTYVVEAPIIIPLLVNITGKHTFDGNVNFTNVEPAYSGSFANETGNGVNDSVNFYHYSAVAQQTDASNASEKHNSLKASGISSNKVVERNKPIQLNYSEQIRENPENEVNNNTVKDSLTKFNVTNSKEPDITTVNTTFFAPKNGTTEEIQEKLSKHKHSYNLTDAQVHANPSKDHQHFKGQKHRNYSAELHTDSHSNETKIKSHKHTDKNSRV